MIYFRFGSAASVTRFDAIDPENRWWTGQNLDFAARRRVQARAGSLFVAHYKAGDTSQNPTGLPCAVVFVGLDGEILYRVTIVPDDDFGRQRCQLLVSALCELSPPQRAAWATTRITQLSDTKPYMGLGLEAVDLELIVENQAFRTKLTNLLAFYTERDRREAERAFLRASFTGWLNDTSRVTSVHPHEILRQLGHGWDLQALRGMLPDVQPMPATVTIMPHGTEAVIDRVAAQLETQNPPAATLPRVVTPQPVRRRRRTSLSFLTDTEPDENNRAVDEVQEGSGAEPERRRPGPLD